VLRYKKDWDELTRRIGYWVDLETPYVTFHNEYIESVWWLLKQMYERDLLFKGYKIQWYSPGSGTVLSSHEVSLGYEEVTDPSVYVRFRDAEDQGLSYLAWTTTPWTLPSNVALVVGEELDYVTVRQGDERLVLATARLAALEGGVHHPRTSSRPRSDGPPLPAAVPRRGRRLPGRLLAYRPAPIT
jgi:isoleucyl-tRNA synthetase